MISSIDDRSCSIVISIIKYFFESESKLYYASGLPDNINEIYEDIKQFNPNCHDGDSKKFYIRRYPEICADLTDEIVLNNLVNDWVSTIYETGKIFILNRNHKQDLLNIFISGVEFQNLSDKYFKDFAICIIENAPEATNHNTFILKCSEKYYAKLKNFIQNQRFIENYFDPE